MKVRVPVVFRSPKIGLILLGASIWSCNTLKRVAPDQQLLTQYKIFTDSTEVRDPQVRDLVLQRPNAKIAGIPLRLHLYNMAKQDADSSFQAWLYAKEGRKDRWEKLLSRKQVERMGESFLVSGYSRWLKRIGEPPAVIDTSITEKSLQRLQAYYYNRGYFNQEADFEVNPTSDRRAEVLYRLKLGEPYRIDSLSWRISSADVDSIYREYQDASRVKAGKQYDLVDFTSERERLTQLFRNRGIWNFQESSVNFDILRDTTSRQDQSMMVELVIDDQRRRGDSVISTQPYRVRRMGDINVFADYDVLSGEQGLKVVREGDLTIFYRDKLKYKPRTLANTIAMRRDSVYRDIDRLRTYRQITNLNTFRYPNIELIESGDDYLDANIYLSARPKNSLGVDFDLTHSNIQRIGVGLGVSLITRNVFGGAETLSLSGRGSFGLLSDDIQGEDFFSEFGGDINLNFPRIWLMPFVNNKNIIPYYMQPQTRVSLGANFQKNIGLDKQTFNNILGYSWSPDDTKNNQLELLNVEFVRNVNIDRFYDVYQSTYQRLDDVADDFEDNPAVAGFYEPDPDNPDELVLTIPEGTAGFTEEVLVNGLVPTNSDTYAEVFRIEERRQRLTENNLIFASNFTHTKNTKTDINDNSFYQLRWKLESAGGLLSAISSIFPFEENDQGQNLVFNVPYSQYVKGEIDYIRHWSLSQDNTLAFHSFVGLAVPFGNADNIPFVRSYFAGGSNDNRAWFPYSLGPGSTRNLNDFNEANFKIALNLEYRFPVVGDLKGAIFSDLGNIWNLWDNEEDPAATFSGFDSLQDIALGTGFGLRYDFTYFVFRADLGFKTYDPSKPLANRWFSEYNFANSVLQIGINYPF
ncbi:Surface antigen [Robiginitalea myxolifaciens]|uniref:Surface antigen n=1 Tax=Robiginitalea myxolifaciens TaxID=400055 RepID=A0A1I6FQJ7_9FLAO|nr:BamA/TamA family outer membrane protein [Robiginitalea myxolifaciens]SFR32154.1 Surface antigen [Robiginitalea myxolifaciens]